MDANELIERYVREVGRHLPRGTRADIEMELRSLLQDSLDERVADSGVKPSADMAAELLREFGKPDVIAAHYRPEQHLIGPQFFPYYKLVLTVVLVIISVVHVAGLVVMLLRGETAVFAQNLWNWLGSYFNTAVLNAGIITLIFAAVERSQIAHALKQPAPDAAWDPFSLPSAKDPDRINRFELGFGMLWTLAFLILFNFFPEWVGVIVISDDNAQFFRLLAPAFAVHVPWLTLAWTLELMLKSVVLVQGRWSRVTRALELALVPLTIYVLNRIRTGGEIFAIAGLSVLVKLILGLVIVIVVLDGLHKLYKLLAASPARPTTIRSRAA